MITQTTFQGRVNVTPKMNSHGGARPGAGRPRKLDKAVSVTLRVPPALLARIDAEAGRRAATRTAVLLELISKLQGQQ